MTEVGVMVPTDAKPLVQLLPKLAVWVGSISCKTSDLTGSDVEGVGGSWDVLGEGVACAPLTSSSVIPIFLFLETSLNSISAKACENFINGLY